MTNILWLCPYFVHENYKKMGNDPLMTFPKKVEYIPKNVFCGYYICETNFVNNKTGNDGCPLKWLALSALPITPQIQRMNSVLALDR